MNYFDQYQIIGICGGAWGDEGKGKFTDYFAKHADLIIRAQGGNNAGHTVKAHGKTLKLHVVPSGIIYSEKINIIGNGVVLDIVSLIEDEINVLKNNSIECENLRISSDANIILPYHKIMDLLKSAKSIGTTAKGIGPCYSDKINRTGIRVGELFVPAILNNKLKKNIDQYNEMFSVYGLDENVISDFIQKNPVFSDVFQGNTLVYGKILDIVNKYSAKIQKYVCNHRKILNDYIEQGKKVLMEGAQGLLLDVDHGTYPFVTSSNACAGGLSTGTGISPERIDKIFSVSGAYLTRVGNGPFPSELGNYDEIIRESLSQRMNKQECEELLQNKKDDYNLGKAIRHLAGEFGTTTGRPRRVGWADVPVLKYCGVINGKDTIITKFDIFDSFTSIKILKNYIYNSEEPVFFNGQTLRKGDTIDMFPKDVHILENIVPGEFIEFEGWLENTSNITEYEKLPENAKKFIKGVEEAAGINIRILSVGPERANTIEIK